MTDTSPLADLLRSIADSLDQMDEVSMRDEVDVIPLPPGLHEDSVVNMLTGRRRWTIEVRNAEQWRAYQAEIASRGGRAGTGSAMAGRSTLPPLDPEVVRALQQAIGDSCGGCGECLACMTLGNRTWSGR